MVFEVHNYKLFLSLSVVCQNEGGNDVLTQKSVKSKLVVIKVYMSLFYFVTPGYLALSKLLFFWFVTSRFIENENNTSFCLKELFKKWNDNTKTDSEKETKGMVLRYKREEVEGEYSQ